MPFLDVAVTAGSDSQPGHGLCRVSLQNQPGQIFIAMAIGRALLKITEGAQATFFLVTERRRLGQCRLGGRSLHSTLDLATHVRCARGVALHEIDSLAGAVLPTLDGIVKVPKSSIEFCSL